MCRCGHLGDARRACTPADLGASEHVRRLHIAEALAWRHPGIGMTAAPQRLAAVG